MKVIPLDASRFNIKQEAHEYLASVLPLPTYYGHNLDALADSLFDLPRDTAIILTNTINGSDYAKQIAAVLCEVLKEGKRIFIIS